MKRKINLGRSSNIIKRQRLLRLSQNNNGSPDNCNINSDNNDDNINNISVTNSVGSINENNINNNENLDEPQVPWRRREMSAFTYDKLIDYKNNSHVIIGNMNLKCNYCRALKWSKEPAGFCCSGGKVVLEDIADPPEPLKSLLNFSHENSKHFFDMIRVYNSAFQMTSFGATEIRHGNFMPTFKVQGQVYHLAGSLLPTGTEEPKFLQIYFMGDSENEVKRRLSIAPNTDKQILYDLQYMLHRNNSYIRSFKSALDLMPSNLAEFKIVIRADRKPQAEHRGRYNTPQTDEVAILIVGHEFSKRDIVLRARDDTLTRVSEIHRAYDALQYPLMFCYGQNGYSIDVSQVNPITKIPLNKTVSAMDFYSYRLQVRENSNNILKYGKLLNQYIVDMYAKIETERLQYLRANQTRLRTEIYTDLQDAMQADGNPDQIGQRVILPSSFVGGPRYMQQRKQDAMVYVRNYGRPDLFITMTCNPQWPDIQSCLFTNQIPADRNDIIARVFNLKVKKLIDLITKEKIYGGVRCYMYTIDWQKRGLPHVHLLVWLNDKLRPNDIDLVLSAELPNQQEDPSLFNVVSRNMIHGPCGTFKMNSPCMQNGKCSKGFPKLFTIATQSGQDGYPKYRRRSPDDGGQTFQLRKSGNRMVTIDNRWIVPYSPLLLRVFDCHINIELCHSVKAIQYICGYINKGSDQAAFSVESRDEIKAFQNGRYISSSEAAWRIFGFTIHERSPAIFQLSVHLENGQRVYFTDQNARERLENVRNTTLMAFFELCHHDEFAKTLLYIEVPSYYTFTNNRFNRRKQGEPIVQYPGVKKSNVLGRVYTVHPSNVECYYLRMLLHHVRGPTSFLDLKTVDDVIHPTFQRACQALGLLQDESHWNSTLEEAALFQSVSNLRELFVTMTAFCHITNLTELWENHKNNMSLDILQQERHRSGNHDLAVTPYILNKTLILIENDLLKISGKKLSDFNMESPLRTDDNDNNFLRDRAYIAETSYDCDILSNYIQENEPKLTNDQQVVYNTILQSVLQDTGELFFLDAPGGTGKTFMLNLLLAKLRVERIISLAVASSGIAATLLQNGKTAHSAFKLPLDLQTNERPVCSVKKQSSLGKLLRETRFIVWDESTMANKGGPEALDRTLRDFKNNDRPMGGVVILFAGDFRQILPVVPKGTKSDEINACLKSSYLWSYITSLRLTTNMRVHLGGDNNAELFSQHLLKIGDGTFQNDKDSIIHINSTFAISVLDQNNLINKVYPEISHLSNKSNEWLRERAILAPKNDIVNIINEKVLSMFEADKKTYISIDTLTNQDEAIDIPTEFLNSLNPSGLPPHKLDLKIGAPIILMRNLNAPKLCNGTRLKILSLKKNIIEAEILTGSASGQMVYIPRIPMITNEYPFDFKRVQFPVKLCFAMSINKAQGQTMKVAGIDISEPCFTHGQFYVACSRVSSEKNLYIYAPGEKTNNIVYKEILVNR